MTPSFPQVNFPLTATLQAENRLLPGYHGQCQPEQGKAQLHGAMGPGHQQRPYHDNLANYRSLDERQGNLQQSTIHRHVASARCLGRNTTPLRHRSEHLQGA